MRKIYLFMALCLTTVFAAKATTVDLSTLTTDYMLHNGDILKGTLNADVKITIAAGATVTLQDAVINRGNYDCTWAGLTCEGSATIKFTGKNKIIGFDDTSSGIYVPEGKTLTIYGINKEDELEARSRGFGAGIGAGKTKSCGNIQFGSSYEGKGTIIAKGGTYSAGIGGGDIASCGNIDIIGSNDMYIVATGNDGAAAIGASCNSSCGNITIYEKNGITASVLATAVDAHAPYSVGKGSSSTSSCGTIKVGETTYTNGIAENPFIWGDASWDGDLSTLTWHAKATDGTTITGTLNADVKITIAAGATVTLQDAVINRGNYDCTWAGLTCEGSATIKFTGKNKIIGFDDTSSGIYVPEGKTLTIYGINKEDELEARSRGFGAGIGAGKTKSCGNIQFGSSYEGKGTIIAKGGTYSAGIGGGDIASCGNIDIIGSNDMYIVATGNDGAAAIGASCNSSCGNITIYEKNGITASVLATAVDAHAPYSVGKGSSSTSSCGTIKVGETTYTNGITENPFLWGNYSWDGDLSTVTKNVVAYSGTTIHGTLNGNYKISIADGAEVTLKDATINRASSSVYKWAGLTCEGSATINVEGTNSIKGFYDEYPGIYVPEGKDLHIVVATDATLDASSNGYAAGIGAGYYVSNLNCGNIAISGNGTITAKGGMYAAGIGAARKANCGNITIGNNVTVIAEGGTNAAGIGGGDGGKCGNITIDNTPKKVTATKGTNAPYSLGAGLNTTCGTIKVGEKTYTNGIAVNPFVWPSGLKIYTVYDGDKTLTYYYDNNYYDRTGTVEFYDPENVLTTARWKEYNEAVETVIIDASMINAPLTSVKGMFYGGHDSGENKDYYLNHAESITGLNFLNTKNVTDMSYMFYECAALTELDLSSFSIDKLKTTTKMFYDCKALKTIYCNENMNNTKVTSSSDMFYQCEKLVGGNGTTFNSSTTNKGYARPDKDGQKGYFTCKELYGVLSDAGETLTIYCDKFKSTRENVSNWPEYSGASDFRNITTVRFDASVQDARPSTTDTWFCWCEKLVTFEHLDYLNTSGVTNMSSMFAYCTALTSINLSSFDITNVTNTTQMFRECINLEYIVCDKDWTTGKISSSLYMFDNCPKLAGESGTAWESSNPKDVTYAHPDEAGNPGYFSKSVPTGIEQTNSQEPIANSQKLLINGQLLILRDGKMYNVMGVEVR